jgi:WD40 repeat protein
MNSLTSVVALGLVARAILPAQTDLFEWSLYGSLNAGQRAGAIAFSPDGAKGAFATISGTVQVFDLARSPQSFRRVAQQNGRVVSLTFASDSSALMSAEEDGTVLITSLASGAARSIRAKAKLLSAAMSRDGALLATAADDNDKSVIVWDVQSGRQINQLRHKGKKPFFSLGFAEKNTLLVGVSASGVICEWDVKTSKILRQTQASDQSVQAASVGGGGKLLAIGTEFADFQKGAFGQMSSARAGMGGLVPGMQTAAEQRSVVGGPASRTARPSDVYRENRIEIYDLDRGSVAKTLDGINGKVSSIALSADGRFVGFVRNPTKASFLAVYDTQRGVEVASASLPGIGTAVSFSHQGQWFGVTTERGDVMVWALKGISIPVNPSDLRGAKFTITSTNSVPLLAPSRPLVLAVMDIDVNGSEPGTGRAVADMVRTRVGEGRNVRIVERAHMEQTIREQNFHLSDRVDPSTAVTLGRMLGASKMLFGDVSKLDAKFVINVRVVDVETGVVDGEREVTCQPCIASDLQEAVIVLKSVLVK